VKHLLILISILLLSSPVIGQETGVLFFSFENGEFVYSEEGEDDNDGKYVGEYKDGKPNGQGTFTYGKGKYEGHKYLGEFKDGKPNGKGTYTWSDGRMYEGEFKDGIKHGQGTWTSIKGYKYVGEWRENKSWNGKEYDKKGNIIGKYVNGVKIMKHLLIILSFLLLSSPLFGQETGVLYQYETSSGFVWKSVGSKKLQPKYEGEIKNGNPNGFGFITYPYDDKSILGEWKNGKEWNTKHTKKDGTLIGKFENGKWILMLGVLYIGERNGKFGYFTEKWEGLENEDNRDIGKYEGEIKNGFPNGQGTFTLNDGEKYVGEFKDGKSHGQGTYTFKKGN